MLYEVITETKVVAVEEADVVDAVDEHGDPLGAHAESKAGEL